MFIAVNSVPCGVGGRNAGFIANGIGRVSRGERIIGTGRKTGVVG